WGCAKGVEHRNDFVGGDIGELRAKLVEGARSRSRVTSNSGRPSEGALSPGPVQFAAGRTEDGVSGLVRPARIEGRSRPYGPGRARQAASDAQSAAKPMHRVIRGAQPQSLHRGKEPRLKGGAVSGETGASGHKRGLTAEPS